MTEQSQEKLCAFRRGDYRDWGDKSEKWTGFESRWRCWVYWQFFLTIFNTHRMIKPMGSFRTLNVVKKLKHLSSVPAKTLRIFCECLINFYKDSVRCHHFGPGVCKQVWIWPSFWERLITPCVAYNKDVMKLEVPLKVFPRLMDLDIDSTTLLFTVVKNKSNQIKW